MFSVGHRSNVRISNEAARSAQLVAFALLGCIRLHAAAPQTHDFGSTPVNGTAASYTISATVATASPVWNVIGASYSIGSVACSLAGGSATCTVPVSFSPQYPGLQLGALLAKDGSGHLLSSYFLKGTGLAGQMTFAPGVAGTVAGNGVWGYGDGVLASASFRNPAGLALDRLGNIYVADSVNQVVRKIGNLSVSTIAGNGISGYTGDNGPATTAELNNPTGVAVDAANNLFIADQGNNVIRRVDAVTGTITTVAGGGSVFVPTASGVLATNALLYGTQSVAVDAAGNLFLSASYYQMVMRVDATTNLIAVYAGGGTGGGSDSLGDGAAATSAILRNPTGLALDGSGNLYIADTGDNMIRMVNATTGVITVVAGSGGYGYSGDAGLATRALLNSPMGVRVDAAGNVYIADSGNNAVRQTLAATGTIITLMGKGSGGYSGDGGLGTNAALFNPSDVVLTSAGTLLIADNGNNVIRQVNPVSPALSFGSAVVGTATPSQPVMLVNRGNQPLTLSGLSFSSGFKEVAGLADCGALIVLLPGGTCTANMAFAPVAAGAVSGGFSVTSNSLNVTSTQTVGLSGTGVAGNAPKAVLNAASFNFGAVAVGSSQSQTVTLANTGAAALAIAGFALTGSGSSAFNITTNCGVSLAAQTTCAITVTFTPVSPASYSATLALNDSAGNSPQAMTMSGSGTAQARVIAGPGNFSFAVQPLWTTSSIQSLVLSNLGNAAAGITSIAIVGANPQDFSFTNNCGNLNPGSSCTISLFFDPQTVGVRSAIISINDTAGDTGLTETLVGIGIAGLNFNSYKSGDVHLRSDFDGDGKTDEVVWRASSGAWYVMPSANTSHPITVQWGLPGDIPVAADYDGDGKADFAVWRPSTGAWYVMPSRNPSSPIIVQWGLPGDVPIVGDYDGDGKADFAVWRPSTGAWYVMPSGNSSNTIVVQWGLAGDVPISGDFDGDGKTDFAVWRPSTGTWYILPSSNPSRPVVQWGLPGDIPIAGDYDGDGKTDFAVWRPSTGSWYVLPSSNPSRPVVQWGLPGDIPMTGDYDGDGKTDYAVWRTSTGAWYILPSASPPITVQWGLPGDVPM